MKKSYFIIIFISTHIFFIFFQIHKHSRAIKLSYHQQKGEQKKKRLVQKIQELTQRLYEKKERSSIKTFAKNTLNMRKIQLNQIKTINLHE